MEEYLKTYQVTLTTVGPVHVGNGRKIGKKEYLFLNGNKVGIIEIDQLYDFLSKKGLRGRFEDFLLKSNKSLGDWLKENNINGNTLMSCMNYTLKYGKLEFKSEKDKKNFGIQEMIKDPYGQPYIPGSSLKGMLRTILLSAEIMSKPEQYRKEVSQLKSISRNRKQLKNVKNSPIKDIEGKAFYTLERNTKNRKDARNDIMGGVIVSDSEPLRTEDLILATKIDKKPGEGENKLNIYRESIKPGVQINFEITIDTQICPYTGEDIERAICKFNEQYYENFSSRFTITDRPKSNIVYLGGGVGFVSKTVIYPLCDYQEGINLTTDILNTLFNTESLKRNRKKYHNVAPHILKCGDYEGETLQMGMCEMTLKEILPR